MENILEIKNLSKKYKGFELKNVNIKLNIVEIKKKNIYIFEEYNLVIK